MKNNKIIKLGIFFLIGILLMSSLVLAYYRSQANYVQYGPYDRSGLFGAYTMDQCKSGQDFILQISPLGCEPAIVRSDLLEEQNAFVMCPISATQMNPLIEVNAIRSMTITGDYPREVATVGFHPAEGALNPYQNEVTQPVILDNIGYAVIVLRKQPNESAMPDYVEGNLTARIRYDIQNAFGVGQSSFYLPVLEDNEWNERYKQYSFWDGRGYLRVEGVYEDEAVISIYSDQSRSGVLGRGDEKISYSTVSLKEGEISDELYIPGFDFCLATMKVRLDDLEAPNTRARFRINGNPIEIKNGEKFLNNNCRIVSNSIVKNGVNSAVNFRCSEDRDGFHTGLINLNINPNIVLSIDGTEREVVVGEHLYDEGNRRIFLGYVGTKGNTGEADDLYAYLVAVPNKDKPENNPILTEEELKGIATIAKRADSVQNIDNPNIFTAFWNDMKKAGLSYFNLYKRFWDWIKDNEGFRRIDYGKDANINNFGKNVQITGFSEPGNIILSEEIQTQFDLAVQDYETIINSFPDEMNEDEKISYGENSLYQLIQLANKLNQKKIMKNYCLEFEENYPDSTKSLEICRDSLKLSSSSSSVTNVLIDNQVYEISFEGVYEPSFYEYGAEVRVNYPDGKTETYTLTKNNRVYLNPEENEYIELIDLEENSAKLDLNIKRTGIGNTFEKKTESIFLNSPNSFNSGYTLTLTKVNLKNVAKVSLIPNIDYAQTEASFNFRVNIDKRDIKLSPEKTAEKIEKLDNQINQWSRISDTLGKVVQATKYACLGTSAYLTVKNYIENTDGKGIARERVMNGEYGWYERCADDVSDGVYANEEQCLIENSDEIGKDVDEYNSFITKQQKDIQNIQKKYESSETIFGTKIVETNDFVNDYSEDVRNNLDGLGKVVISDPLGKSEDINVEDIQNVLSSVGFEEGKYSIEQLREVDLYTRILNSNEASADAKKMAERNLYTTLLQVKVNSEEEATRFTLLNELNANNALSNVKGNIYGTKESITGVYGGGTTGASGFGQIPANVPVELIVIGGTGYLVELEAISSKDYAINNLYDPNGNLITDENVINKITGPEGLINGFIKYDDSAYQNEYKNPEVRYYETAPYKGYPAIVPFDLEEGWYVAVKQTLPVFGNTASYSQSGRVESFYLCNVGRNSNEENVGGDDICRSVVSLQENIYQFPGISDKGKVSSLLMQASQAVEEAQHAYRAGVNHVTINGKRIPVGNPAVDVPEYKCQDFMSPKDCNTLFNVCDPVVCPSSRCNLGGNYYVQDVIRSGIIGSIALCLPNAQEGIHVPVCLSGINAGLEGWLSVLNTYKGCLQENLDTGQTTGICDEIQSVYMCEYFYRQALPAAKLGIPRFTELLTGRGSRGGGEYLAVQDAYDRAENSVDYFANYYAANSHEAFKARSVEEAGQELVCKTFVSLSYPDSGGLLDTITTPDSPVQFYGRFSEIPYTSVTNPPQSQYKVFYHIYSGKDTGAYYRVYLRGSSSSSFYQDNLFRIDVVTGYVGRGDTASETKDFTAPSGYKELCIMVNGQEECGFGEATTSFAATYISDRYVASQVNRTDIKTETECISGTPSSYSLLNPNIQAGVEEAISPSLYGKGVTRICSTRNPGEGTNPSRWNQVGYCGDVNLKCWLDTQSVEQAIDIQNIQDDVLKNTNDNYQNILREQGGYLTEESFKSSVDEIGNTESNPEKISLINQIIDEVFFNSEKASLLYLRGNAYGDIALSLYGKYNGKKCSVIGEEKCSGTQALRCGSDKEWYVLTDCSITNKLCTTKGTDKAECVDGDYLPDLCENTGEEYCDGTQILRCSSSGSWDSLTDCANTGRLCTTGGTDKAECVNPSSLGNIPSGETCDIVEPLDEIDSISNARLKVLGTTEILDGTSSAGFDSCYTSAKYVYDSAGVYAVCVYSDKVGKEYNLDGITIETEPAPTQTEQDAGVPYPLFAVNENCPIVGEDENNKLNLMAPGYFLSYYWGTSGKYPNGAGHNAIFINWSNQATREAWLFDWNGPGDTFRYYEEDLSDDEHPVYLIWKPKKA